MLADGAVHEAQVLERVYLKFHEVRHFSSFLQQWIFKLNLEIPVGLLVTRLSKDWRKINVVIVPATITTCAM